MQSDLSGILAAITGIYPPNPRKSGSFTPIVKPRIKFSQRIITLSETNVRYPGKDDNYKQAIKLAKKLEVIDDA
jgi:hypothetical protein